MLLEIGKGAVATRFFGNYLKGPVFFSRRGYFCKSLLYYSAYDKRRLFEIKPFRGGILYTTQKILKHFFSSEKFPELLDRRSFESVCSETLESLAEYFEELIETVPKFKNGDVQYSDGVLTVTLGENDGIYVINKQGTNCQIWLSSPKSGPKRYDFVKGTWIYKYDKTTLHSLLDEEIGEFTSEAVQFTEKCLHAKVLH